MAIEDYIPNIFGNVPVGYEGLLGAEQSAALQKRSNLAGLLGFGAALAQGMSPGGYRRSALQNVLTAAAQGFTGAGQTYEAGIGQIVNAQKIAQSQAQIAAINQLLRDPRYANDPAMQAYIRANPQDALKLVAEQSQFEAARKAAMPTPAAPVSVAPTPAAPAPAIDLMGMRPDALPPFKGEQEVYRVPMPNQESPAPKPAAPTPIAATSNPEIANLEKQIQLALVDANTYMNLRKPTEAEASTRIAERLRERQQQLMAAETNLDQRIADAPQQFKEQYSTLKSLKNSLKPKEFMDALQKVDTAVQESSKQFKFDGIAGNFAYRMFGTTDMTKMTPQQMDLVLRYQNAPTQADQTKIVIDAQRLLEETGARVPVPTSREAMIGNVTPPAPAVAQVAPAPVAPTAVVTPKPVTTPTEAKQVVKDVSKPVVDINVTPLIKQSDTAVPPKAKKELLLKQPSTVALGSYALKNVLDARDSAEKLLNNPAYIDALTGVTAPAMKNIPGTDAFTANQLMQNLLGRAFVNELSQMRNASPTGGAVGNVAVAEMDSLSKIQSALTVGMKRDEFEKQLRQYINVSNRAIKTIPNEYARTYGYNGEFDDLLRGTVVETGGQAAPQGVKVKRIR
jgi:hypothetical protein